MTHDIPGETRIRSPWQQSPAEPMSDEAAAKAAEAEEWQKRLGTINKRAVVERKFQAPWSTAGVGKMHDTSVSQEALSSGVNVRDTFHHYYKKHMTLLGLRKDLDSDETDSEDSDNYRTKLFRRRQHRLKPRPVDPQIAADKQRLEALKGKPWSYRCPGVDDVGIQNAEKHDKGKKTGGFLSREEHSQRRIRETEQRQGIGRKTPMMRLHEIIEENKNERSMFPNDWDRREVEEQEEKRRHRRAFKPLPVAPTPAELTKQRLTAARLEEAEEKHLRHPPRASTSMTMLEMDRTLARIRKDHNESMQRHRMVMDEVQRIPLWEEKKKHPSKKKPKKMENSLDEMQRYSPEAEASSAKPMSKKITKQEQERQQRLAMRGLVMRK